MSKKTRLAEQVGLDLQQQVDALLEARQFLLAQPDAPEALHGLRVALRRLRSGLRPLRRWLGASPVAAKALALLRQLGQASNPLRDHEVQTGLIAKLLMPVWQAGHMAWQAERVVANQAARAALLQTLADDALPRALVDLRLELASLLKRQRRTLRQVLRSERAALARQIARRSKRIGHTLRRSVRWHALRLDCKKLRYLLEGYRASCGKGWRAEAVVAKAAQDTLGHLRDLELLAESLLASGQVLDHIEPYLYSAHRQAEWDARRSLRVLRRGLNQA